jgi:hypothetical protein
MVNLNDLSREDLLKLVEMYAKNWLAHDGCWFLALEERFGMETAIEMDTRSWERFTVIEARRIMQTFAIPETGGLAALEEALGYRLYACINQQEAVWVDDRTLEFRMIDCRVQSARRRKGLPDFPCKPVGLVEYTSFASTIDPRIRTECLACPPDDTGETYCHWRFTLEEVQAHD